MYLIIVTVAPMSAYVKGRMEDKKCRRARCLCDMEMVRCMGHYKNEIDTTKVLHQQCNITGNDLIPGRNDFHRNPYYSEILRIIENFVFTV